jgi:hypothetical protein
MEWQALHGAAPQVDTIALDKMFRMMLIDCDTNPSRMARFANTGGISD